MKSFALLIAGLVVFFSASYCEAERPNILFILVDDMGYGDPGFNNPNSKIRTPNIDSLAEEGMRFTDCAFRRTPVPYVQVRVDDGTLSISN